MRNKLLWLLVVLLVSETVFLAMINKNLRKKLNKCRFILYTPEVAAEQSRMPIVPNFKIINILDGKPGHLFDQSEKENILLFMFSTDCSHCDQMAETWNDIYYRFQNSYTIFGISQQSPQEIKAYISRNDIRFPVVYAERLSDFGFLTFPQTILTNPQGQIKTNIKGYDEELIKKLNLQI